jgi:hypothetical protein
LGSVVFEQICFGKGEIEMETISCIVPLLGFEFAPMFFQILAGDNGSEMMVMMWGYGLAKSGDFWELKRFLSCIACTKDLIFGLMVNSRDLTIHSYCVGFRGLHMHNNAW